MEEERACYLDPIDWSKGPCWDVRHCPTEWKEKCLTWQYQAGGACWEVGGTFCQGRLHNSAREKRQLCNDCDVFQSMLLKPK